MKYQNRFLPLAGFLALMMLMPIQTAEAGLFFKIGDIKGASTNQDHKDWLVGESMNFSIFRSIPDGARGTQRTRGETRIGDLTISRALSKASTKLFEAVAKGTFFAEVEIHLTRTVGIKEIPYLTLKIKNVIITSVSSSANSSGDPRAAEEITLSYTAVDWEYTNVNPETGAKEGTVPAKYEPSEGRD